MNKEKIVCEKRTDEGLRTFKGETIGTIRTIDSGDKRVIEIEKMKIKDGVFFFDKGIFDDIENDKGQANFSDCNYRIRKLTPKECWRLQGFSDESFEKARETLNNKFYKGKDKSSSQLYKQAGNSIVTDVLFYIFLELYKAMPYLFDELKVSSYFSGIGAFEIALDRLFDCINSENFQTPQLNCPTVVK